MRSHSLGKDQILDELRRVARELARRPSRAEFMAHSGIAEYHILKHFPSWNRFVAAAGLEPNTSNVKLDDDPLLDDWGKLVRELRQIPTRAQYGRHGKFSRSTFEKHFGPWSGIPDVLRQFAGDKPEWIDVVTLLQRTTPKVKLSEPTSRNLEAASRFRDSSSRSPARPSHSRLDDRPVYGNPIDFRGLRHEPVNENGVIFLFGMVARDLGYSVEAVQQGFPDCEAKRLVGVGKWQRVRIEFEYESRSFRDHGHSVGGCDVIVCWRHNWPECPQEIEIVELCEEIKRLAKSEE